LRFIPITQLRTLVLLDDSVSYTLPARVQVGREIQVADNLGLGAGGITIIGPINGAGSDMLTEAYQSKIYFWEGSAYIIESLGVVPPPIPPTPGPPGSVLIIAPVWVNDVDTSSGPQSFTLPTAPEANEQWRIKDAKGHAGTNNITVAAGGTMIDNGTNYVIDQNWASRTFRWNPTLGIWLVE
jgi:hypothetical protein